MYFQRSVIEPANRIEPFDRKRQTINSIWEGGSAFLPTASPALRRSYHLMHMLLSAAAG
jgi:hypothetical protein